MNSMTEGTFYTRNDTKCRLSVLILRCILRISHWIYLCVQKFKMQRMNTVRFSFSRTLWHYDYFTFGDSRFTSATTKHQNLRFSLVSPIFLSY